LTECELAEGGLGMFIILQHNFMLQFVKEPTSWYTVPSLNQFHKVCSTTESHSPWLWFTHSVFCSEDADEVPWMGGLLLLLPPLCLPLCSSTTLTGLCHWAEIACYWQTSSLPTLVLVEGGSITAGRKWDRYSGISPRTSCYSFSLSYV